MGDTLWHDGERYRVIHVTDSKEDGLSVNVELDSEGLGDLLSSERGGFQLVPVEA